MYIGFPSADFLIFLSILKLKSKAANELLISIPSQLNRAIRLHFIIYSRTCKHRSCCNISRWVSLMTPSLKYGQILREKINYIHFNNRSSHHPWCLDPPSFFHSCPWQPLAASSFQMNLRTNLCNPCFDDGTINKLQIIFVNPWNYFTLLVIIIIIKNIHFW